MGVCDDFISRQAAIDAVHHTIYEFFDVVEDDDETPMTDFDKKLLEVNKSISKRIASIPTADVVEVVRCKDCKYKEGSACDYSAVYVRPNGYCQWGERREDAET